MINPWRDTSKTRLPIFQVLSRITSETNAVARLFESCSGALRAPNSASHGGHRLPLQLFLPRVTADQLALCDHMTFYRGIQLAPLCTRRQIQFAIESENLE